MKLSAPWYTYRNKVNALFALDDDIDVGEVQEDEDGTYVFEITAHSPAKFIALDRVMPRTVVFGKTVLKIIVRNNEDDSTASAIKLYKTLFEGNRIVKDIKEATDFTGSLQGYIRFYPEVLQFFNDDISSFDGLWSGLAQDIAREVFTNQEVHFCTADLRENQADVKQS